MGREFAVKNNHQLFVGDRRFEEQVVQLVFGVDIACRINVATFILVREPAINDIEFVDCIAIVSVEKIHELEVAYMLNSCDTCCNNITNTYRLTVNAFMRVALSGEPRQQARFVTVYMGIYSLGIAPFNGRLG